MNSEHKPADQRDIHAAFSEDPEAVLELLEADQVVAAKRASHFGRRPISRGLNLVLWGLRIYVLVMLVLVVIAVYRALP